ncbi:MAG: hypothetical protein JWP31_1932, partial [Aeromicrobium sp.]|nr:hypothetical protein [Aeromicrobium sp.]
SMTKLLSFKPSTVLEDVDRERSLLTGDFADEYTKLVKKGFGPDVVKGKVSTTAEIPRAGVVSSSGDTVVVMLFANVTRTSPASEDTRVSGGRMRVTMKKVDGDWKISDYKSL